MLRDEYGFNSHLEATIEKFALQSSKFVDVKLFKMITPDCFLWRLRMTDLTYYLYAEDYVNDVSQVRQTILCVTDATDGEFIAAKKPNKKYRNSELRRLAVEDGFDSVFLFKSNLDGEYDE